MAGQIEYGWANTTYYVSSARPQLCKSSGTIYAPNSMTQDQIERTLLCKIKQMEKPGAEISIVKTYLSALGPVLVPDA